jgi:hypothetical protein
MEMRNVVRNWQKKEAPFILRPLRFLRRFIVTVTVLAVSHNTLLAKGGFLYNHFYTADPKERDDAIKNNGFYDESDLDPIYVFTQPVKVPFACIVCSTPTPVIIFIPRTRMKRRLR